MTTALKYEVQIRHVLYLSLVLSAEVLHCYKIMPSLEIIIIFPRGSIQEDRKLTQVTVFQSSAKLALDIGPIQIQQKLVLGIRIRIFLGLPDPGPLVRGMDPDPSLFS